MFYQNSVVKKYLALQKSEQLTAAWKQYKAYFHNPAIQENIRASKEEQFQEGFLRELFVRCLGYTLNPTPDYNLITEQKNETDAKKADGAILREGKVIGVIELKDHKTTDLSQVERQAFGYKNQHKDTRYVVISNFEKLRFYIDNAVEHLEWNLFELGFDDFRLLYFCLSWESLSHDLPLQAKKESVSNEDEITQQLYKDYSAFKREIFADILAHNTNPETPKEQILLLFKKTQKLLDRLLFIFFAEDCGLLPPNSMVEILNQWETLKEMDAYVPLYDRIKKYFGYMNTGWKGKRYEIFAYNGGLFKPDEVLDSLTISDDLLARFTRKLADYDYSTEVDVNILGHIFENSLNEIEKFYRDADGSSAKESATEDGRVPKTAGEPPASQVSKRKRDGVFYTPQYITKYIVENTVGKLCEEKKAELGIVEHVSERADNATFGNVANDKRTRAKKAELEKLEQYREWLLGITICDPACGSGAFLNAALQFLMAEHRLIDEMQAKITGDSIVFQNIENSILENNLYGVDINEESVEIARLALWLRTAKPHRKLSSLNNNIKCGNSLISDPAVAGDKAFDWQAEFPQVFRSASVLTRDDRNANNTNASGDTCAPGGILTRDNTNASEDTCAPGKYNIDIKPWHSRNYLPHIEDKQFQFITFRLYDSMPRYIINTWKEELNITDEEKTPIPILTQLLDRINKYEDAGYGQCFLKDERIAKLVENALLHFDGERYRLLCWCIMPNHVHVLIEMMPEYSLTSILHSWRTFTAREANKILGRTGEFWQKEYFDRYIRNAQHYRDTIDYIDNNPVKAGLVSTPEEWPFGSATRSASVLTRDDRYANNTNASEDTCAPGGVPTSDNTNASEDTCAPGGFDVIIGNPPYVNVENIPVKDKEFYKNAYKSFYKRSDLFSLFVEKGLTQLTHQNSKVAFIIPSIVLNNLSYQPLRDIFLNNHWLKEVSYVGGAVFSDATVDTSILIFDKQGIDDITLKHAVNFHEPTIHTVPADYFKTFKNTISIGEENADTITDKLFLPEYAVVDDCFTVFQGIVTGNNDAFIFENEEEALNKGIEKELLHTLCHGRDIGKWETRNLERKILYVDDNTDLSLYPNTYKWLYSFKEKQDARNEGKKTDLIVWDRLHRPRVKSELDTQEKILIQNTRNESLKTRIVATIDKQGVYASQGINFVIPKTGEYSIYFLLALLNSKLMNYLFSKKFLNLAIKAEYIKQLHFPRLSLSDQQPFIDLADRMLSLNKDLQEKRGRFLRRLQDNLRSASVLTREKAFASTTPIAASEDTRVPGKANASGDTCAPGGAPVRITTALETFDSLEFADFVAELKKQKIKLTLVQQDEWEEYFTQYKAACGELTDAIAATDSEIDQRVYNLYGLTEEEIKLIEQI